MMRHTVPMLVVALALVGCRKDEPVVAPPDPVAPVVRLTVAPMWNGMPFNKAVIYENISAERIQVQMLKFYLGDLELYTSGGDTIDLVDVDLFKLTDGPVVRSYTAVPGTFSGLRVGLGVPAALNGMDPVMWANDEPLSIANGMYWTWSSMYRFMIFDGRFDTLATNTGTPPYLFSIHTGRNECYRSRAFALPITTTDGTTTDLRLELDLARFFYSASDTLYMSTESQQHGSIEEVPMSQKFSDMVIASMSLTNTP
jgi:hypothetical protein